MNSVDISRVKSAIQQLRSLPLLGKILHRTGFSSRTSAICLIALAFPLALVWVIPAMSTTFRVRGGADVILLILLGASIGVIPMLLIWAWDLISLDRWAKRHRLGGYSEWMDSCFSPRRRLPFAFPKESRRRIVAVLVLFLAVCLAIVGVSFLLITAFVPGAIFLALHFAVWRRFRRMTAVSATDILSNDKRQPILLLRSFDDDSIRLKPKFFSFHIGKPYRFEEKMVTALWQMGPVVTVGKPGESLPEFGACREYHAEDSWRPRVQELIGEAKVVVMLVGLTESLDWEVQQLRELGAIHKTLFLLPPISKSKIHERLNRFEQRAPEFTPESNVSGRFRRALGFFNCSEDGPLRIVSNGQSIVDYEITIYAVSHRIRGQSQYEDVRNEVVVDRTPNSVTQD